METKTINMIGAAAVIAVGAATASPATADPIPPAASYADLLQPVPNAMSRLNADDAARQNAPAELYQAQYNPGGPVDHHHHHHHHHNRRWYMQHGYYWNGRTWMMRPRHHHHHHHHQQS